ncbi:MAG: hypothetical protein KJP23_03020 [Deltaproteobacteria bacterium]|nr:hypothetical protein [Deltaproteobacteria bacterium]
MVDFLDRLKKDVVLVAEGYVFEQESADFIIAETFGHLGEARLALEAIKAGG